MYNSQRQALEDRYLPVMRTLGRDKRCRSETSMIFEKSMRLRLSRSTL